MAVTMEQIQNEQKALLILIESLQGAQSFDDKQAMMPMINEQTKKLTDLLAEFEKEHPAREIDTNAILPVVEVVLTPAQRRRVKEQTDIDVPSVRIPDPDHTLTTNMEHIDPDFIEQKALEQANAFKKMMEEQEAVMAAQAAAENPDEEN